MEIDNSQSSLKIRTPLGVEIFKLKYGIALELTRGWLMPWG
jgi:hypothetical protein